MLSNCNAPGTNRWEYDSKQHVCGSYSHQVYNLTGKTDIEQVIENVMNNSKGIVQKAWGV